MLEHALKNRKLIGLFFSAFLAILPLELHADERQLDKLAVSPAAPEGLTSPAASAALPPQTTPANATPAANATPSVGNKSAESPLRAPASATFPVEELSGLLRGDVLFASGDVAAARRAYQPSANAGDRDAAVRLGETFDPSFLSPDQLSAGDPAKSAYWYRKARDLGSVEAGALLQVLQASHLPSSAAPAGRDPGNAASSVASGAPSRNNVVSRAGPGLTTRAPFSQARSPKERTDPVQGRLPSFSSNVMTIAVTPQPAQSADDDKPGARTEPVTVSANARAGLLKRGDTFFGAGDIVSARLFYQRAANAGDSIAALRLGETYDSGFLSRARMGFIAGDAARANYWYNRARDLGNADADVLLKFAGSAVK